MTALERIARALAAQHWRDAGASEEQVLAFADIDWPEFVPDARAALTALREPDEAMSLAGLTAFVECAPKPRSDEDTFSVGVRVGRTTIASRETDAVWRAMIDAALQEGQ